MKGILIIICIVFSSHSHSESFQSLVSRLDNHDLLLSQLDEASALKEKAITLGSFGDPKLSVAAMNFPKESLKQDESMMTGIQFGLMQKLSISGKYGKIKESALEKSKTQESKAIQLKREFLLNLWLLSISKERLVQENKILKDNLDWIEGTLKVTKRLYSTGKVPQQAVFDIQIRRSSLKTQIEKNKNAQKILTYNLSVLMNSDKELDIELKTIPWDILSNWDKSSEKYDFKRKELLHNLKASELGVSAKNRNYIPDITFGVSYTKRNEIDGMGDFVGASISFPIPTSDSRYAAKDEAVFKKYQAEKTYRHYLNTKPNLLKKMELEILDVKNELKRVQVESLKYAKSSRDITAKSYSRGGADYLELLRAQLQFQKELLKEVNLNANLKNKKINYLFLKGSSLSKGSSL